MPESLAGLQPFPLDLPPDFLARLGYERAVGTRMPLTDQMRDQLRREYGTEGLPAFEASVAARQPRRYVALFWEPAGDELGWTDGRSSGAGQLNHWLYLDLVHRPQVHAWLVEHAVDPGSSEASGTHALVRAQRLEGPPMA